MAAIGMALDLDLGGAAFDPDMGEGGGDTLSLALSLAGGGALPGWLSLDPETGRLTGTPGPADMGVLELTFTVTDFHGLSVSDDFTIRTGTLREGTEGADTLRGTASADWLRGLGGPDVILAGAGNDLLQGGDGTDRLDGGLGADTLEGGGGNDTYVVDDLGDVVIEVAGGGSDRVSASISYTLGAELERLSLSGTANLNGTGNVLANRLDGNAGANILGGGEGNDSLHGLGGNDSLIGGAGNDLLDGGLGADTLEGGAGDDSYIVDNADDVVVEQAGGGSDRLSASLNWALGAEIERLILTGTAELNGTGNVLANRLDGNAGANILDGGEGNDSLHGLGGNDSLIGGAGNDLLDGGLGADTLEGGADNDTYVVDDLGDVVIEVAGGGSDRVSASTSYTLGAELERLSLSGTANLNGTGNVLANRLDGNAGANILDGGEGNDSLYGLGGGDTLIGGVGADLLEGGLGADRITGGLGADRFVFRGAAEADGDVIADFIMAHGDRIDLRPIDTNPDLAGDQAFAWIGGGSFAGVAGQLRFADGLLEGDVDGNGLADFQIGLSGVAALTAASIWL
jgi:Ca2+-binding RTX toxin-like protein